VAEALARGPDARALIQGHLALIITIDSGAPLPDDAGKPEARAKLLNLNELLKMNDLKFHLLPEHVVEAIRRDFRALTPEQLARYRTPYCPTILGSPFVQYGNTEIKTATGRSRSRIDGSKIAKGEEVLAFVYDFGGSGSWTASPCQIPLSALR